MKKLLSILLLLIPLFSFSQRYTYGGTTFTDDVKPGPAMVVSGTITTMVGAFTQPNYDFVSQGGTVYYMGNGTIVNGGPGYFVKQPFWKQGRSWAIVCGITITFTGVLTTIIDHN
jgi:hypothetical protein